MTTLSPPRVTAQDIAFYRQHGWWVSPPFLSDATLDMLKFGVERYLAGERDWALPVNLGEEQAAAAVRQTDYLSLQIEEFRDIMHDRSIAQIAGQLAGTAAMRLFHDQLVTKPPFDPSRKAVVGWHTDRAYWRTCTSTNMLTAWIPLDDVPESKGPLAVWDGSHRWPEVDTLHSFDRDDLAAIEDRFRRQGLAPEIVFLPMQRGQVSFHHCLLVHGGLENRSDTPRYGYAIHMQDADNRYHVPTEAGRHGHVNDLLCRRTAEGHPDYADPDIFPQLWP